MSPVLALKGAYFAEASYLAPVRLAVVPFLHHIVCDVGANLIPRRPPEQGEPLAAGRPAGPGAVRPVQHLTGQVKHQAKPGVHRST